LVRNTCYLEYYIEFIIINILSRTSIKNVKIYNVSLIAYAKASSEIKVVVINIPENDKQNKMVKWSKQEGISKNVQS
jgi:hypothetical protein